MASNGKLEKRKSSGSRRISMILGRRRSETESGRDLDDSSSDSSPVSPVRKKKSRASTSFKALRRATSSSTMSSPSLMEETRKSESSPRKKKKNTKGTESPREDSTKLKRRSRSNKAVALSAPAPVLAKDDASFHLLDHMEGTSTEEPKEENVKNETAADDTTKDQDPAELVEQKVNDEKEPQEPHQKKEEKETSETSETPETPGTPKETEKQNEESKKVVEVDTCSSEEKEDEKEESDVDYGDSVFFLPETEKIIVYSDTNTPYHIQYASVYKLIEKVTTPIKEFTKDYNEFMSVFFMTYRSFTTAELVLELIIKRFKGPEGATEEQMEKIDIEVIREGVCKSLVHWFNNHYRDFSGCKPLSNQLEGFIDWMVENHPPKKGNFVGYLQKMYAKKSGKGTYTSLFDSGIMVDKDSCPDPIVPKSWNGITLMDIDEVEIARQLTITEHHIYAEIQPVELQELAWSKPKLKHLAPQLLQMIKQFNTFSNAISSLIVTCPKLKLRKKLIEKLVRISENLLEMNSFNMVMAIFSAFQNAAVHRLNFSFGGVNKKTTESIERIENILSSRSSYKTYRDMLNSLRPPCIPFLGVYLSDLTFIDEGNPKIVKGLVNFRKKQLEYGVIIQVLRFQSQAYQFKLLPKFSQLFKSLPQMTDQELYEASLSVEPRKAKKKDIK